MNQKSKISFAITLALVGVFLALVLFPAQAFAEYKLPDQFVPQCESAGGVQNVCSICHLFQLINNILGFIFFTAVIGAIVMLLYGGFLMIMPWVDPNRYTRARKVLTNALIGVLIIFGAWLAVDTIIKILAQQTISPGKIPKDVSVYGPWNRITCNSGGADDGEQNGNGNGTPPPPPPSETEKIFQEIEQEPADSDTYEDEDGILAQMLGNIQYDSDQTAVSVHNVNIELVAAPTGNDIDFEAARAEFDKAVASMGPAAQTLKKTRMIAVEQESFNEIYEEHPVLRASLENERAIAIQQAVALGIPEAEAVAHYESMPASGFGETGVAIKNKPGELEFLMVCTDCMEKGDFSDNFLRENMIHEIAHAAILQKTGFFHGGCAGGTCETLNIYNEARNELGGEPFATPYGASNVQEMLATTATAYIVLGGQRPKHIKSSAAIENWDKQVKWLAENGII